MAYSVNWVTGEISIPVSDMTLVSGTEYTIDTENIRKELRRLEWDFNEGLYAPSILNFVIIDPVSGVDYADFVIIINGYTITFDPTATKVTILGSNHNIADVYNANGVSIVTNNSAGKQVVSGAGSITQADIDNIADAVWDEPVADHQQVGSMGEKLDNLNVNVDNNSIATAVWAHATRTLTESAGVTPQDVTDIANAVWQVTVRSVTEDVTLGTSAINSVRDAVWSATSRVLTDYSGFSLTTQDIVDIRDSVWSATSRTITGNVTLTAGTITSIRDSVWNATTKELTALPDMNQTQLDAIRDAVWLAASRTLTDELGLLTDERNKLLSLPDENTIALAVINTVVTP